MIELCGKYNIAKCFADSIEDTARSQLMALCDMGIYQGNNIRVMPDVHAGMGCTIGTTMTLTNSVISPSLVGCDIGCGVTAAKLKAHTFIDFDRLSEVIREFIPYRAGLHSYGYFPISDLSFIRDLKCCDAINIPQVIHAFSTLGSGNHYIEVAKDSDDFKWIIVHSGSRSLGVMVESYYRKLAWKTISRPDNNTIRGIIDGLKSQHREIEISSTIRATYKKTLQENLAYREVAWLTGQNFDDYIHDMNIACLYADLNRRAMIYLLLELLNLTASEWLSTVHNYIDTDTMTMRKGAVRANAGEHLIIPLNARDGSLLCVGKGNPDWNYSAPHGAGRRLSRNEAKAKLSLDDYKASMSDIYSKTVSLATLDEAPEAYKNADLIATQIEPTATIIDRLIPVFNFKAGEID